MTEGILHALLQLCLQPAGGIPFAQHPCMPSGGGGDEPPAGGQIVEEEEEPDEEQVSSGKTKNLP